MFRPSIIIPTKDRVQALSQLLASITQLEAIDRIHPEVIVADNDSRDNTYEHVISRARCFPTTMRMLKVTRPGKSAATNEALKAATGNVVAFLDDDVAVDRHWLAAVETFFRNREFQVGQGIIRLPSPDKDDADILDLVDRYRTVPRLEYKRNLRTIRSVNGANFFAAREVFEKVGGFDERLGPGASGTSEDVDFARRLGKANIPIGYVPQAIVYHRIDRNRLTEEYFKQNHFRQGRSRFLIRPRADATILFSLARAVVRYAYYSITGNERDRYRSKGRIYHYLGMLEAKKKHASNERD